MRARSLNLDKPGPGAEQAHGSPEGQENSNRLLQRCERAEKELHTLKEQLKKLREDADRHRRVVEQVEEYAIFMLDPAGEIVTWNQGVERVLGYTEREFIGRSVSIIFTPADRKSGAVERELAEARRTGSARDERLHVRKDGSLFWASGILTALHDDSHALSGFSKVMRDNTERRLASDALKEAQTNLERRVDERTLALSETVDRLREEILHGQDLERALLDVTEAERKRLGDDLHDGVCQHLMGAALLATVLARNLAKQDSAGSEDASQLAALVRQGADDARKLAKGLHPAGIHSSDGLPMALAELADQTRLFCSCSLKCPPRILLPERAALHVFRIAQEAVHDAIRSGKASEIRVAVELAPDRMLLSVADNGRDFPFEPMDGRETGLLAMESRSRLLGATLERSCPASGGACVTLAVPLPAH